MVKEILIFDEMWEGGEVNGKAGVVQLILLATYYGLNGGMIADGEMMVIGGKMMVDRKWASTDQEVLPGAGQGSHHLSLPPPPISKRESWEVSCILPFFILMHTCSAQSSHNLSLKSTISKICLGGGTKKDVLETF